MVYNVDAVTTHAPTAESWTTRRLLAWMGPFFARRQIDSPRLCAELLIAHVLGCERMRLYMDADRPTSPDELIRLREYVERAGRHEAIQYLLGEGWFFTRPFTVNPAVLIPRPSTERIIEEVMQRVRAESRTNEPLALIDIGTGSGILAVTLALSLPPAHLIATDLSPQAIEVARGNAHRHGVADRIEFVQGSLLEPLTHRTPPVQADFLVSNPPYVSDAEWEAVEANVRDFEPTIALRAGVDGLDYLRPLIASAHRLVAPGGEVLLEIADSQAEVVRSLAAANPALGDVRILNDYEQLPRVLAARVLDSA